MDGGQLDWESDHWGVGAASLNRYVKVVIHGTMIRVHHLYIWKRTVPKAGTMFFPSVAKNVPVMVRGMF